MIFINDFNIHIYKDNRLIYYFLLCFMVELIKTNIPLFIYIFHYSEKNNCYAGVSMALTLFCSPAYLNKRNVYKAGHKRRQYDDVIELLFYTL